jgi:MFS family permease
MRGVPRRMVADNLTQSTPTPPARDPVPSASWSGSRGSQRVSVIESGPRLVFVTVGVLLATLLELIDTTIVNVALPYIQGNLGASLEEGTFIVTGYIVANVIVIPLTPWLQRRFGRRQYFFTSILIFTAASLMCGLSRSLTELVFWRVIQGLGGGGLISTSQAILRESFPADKQAAAQAIFSVGVIIGPTVGPVLGGLLTDTFSWPWVFFVNIPVGIAAMFLVGSYLRNRAGLAAIRPRPGTRERLVRFRRHRRRQRRCRRDPRSVRRLGTVRRTLAGRRPAHPGES